MITAPPALMHWHIAIAIAHTESTLTGVRQVVRKVDGQWRSEPAAAPPVWEPAEFQAYADRRARGARLGLSGATLLGRAHGIRNDYRCQKCGASTFSQPCPSCRGAS